ncbi:MAG: hypothetical protein ACRD2L_13615 [Terriglobia bacterium]
MKENAHSGAERSKELRPDAKGRILLGRLAKGVSSFRVETDRLGRIILEPQVTVPKREQWLYTNPKARKSLLRGLAESEAGRTKSRGDFSRYVVEDESAEG